MKIEALLREAEVDAEKVSATVRVVVFLTLASVILSAEASQGPEFPMHTSVVVYGIGAVAGMVLAWLRIFHPIIPYLFVSFDVILVSAQLMMLTGLMAMAPSFAFAMPAAGLVFVILIHASMRYRPWLIIYAAVLFLAVFVAGNAVFPASEHLAGHGMAMMQGGGMESFMHFQALPVALVALATFILFFIGQRTRGLLLRSITQTNRAARLARFFSPNLATSLAEGDDERLLAGRRLSAAVLFVDIRGFTALGETMTPEELSQFLTEFRNRLTKPIFTHDGTVDKFIGDAIMAVFGTPLEMEGDAGRAISCAIGIIEATKAWSQEREGSGQPPVKIGIGLHYGEVFAGALGDEQLLEYTVIGDTVNVAERLERLSREVGSPLVVSAAVLEAAAELQPGRWRRLPPQELRGHSRPVDVYCLDQD